MSVGVWSENAHNGEDAAIRAAIVRGRESLKTDRTEVLDELRQLADSVFGDIPVKKDKLGRKNRGRNSAISVALFPYRDESAERNFRVIFWDSDIKHIEYTPVKRYKGEVVDDVDKYDIVGHSETMDTMDPLDVICLKETIRERTSKMAFPEKLLQR